MAYICSLLKHHIYYSQTDERKDPLYFQIVDNNGQAEMSIVSKHRHDDPEYLRLKQIQNDQFDLTMKELTDVFDEADEIEYDRLSREAKEISTRIAARYEDGDCTWDVTGCHVCLPEFPTNSHHNIQSKTKYSATGIICAVTEIDEPISPEDVVRALANVSGGSDKIASPTTTWCVPDSRTQKVCEYELMKNGDEIVIGSSDGVIICGRKEKDG